LNLTSTTTRTEEVSTAHLRQNNSCANHFHGYQQLRLIVSHSVFQFFFKTGSNGRINIDIMIGHWEKTFNAAREDVVWISSCT
jgi:hypothetical protein